jgi:hypothetical protein
MNSQINPYYYCDYYLVVILSKKLVVMLKVYIRLWHRAHIFCGTALLLAAGGHVSDSETFTFPYYITLSSCSCSTFLSPFHVPIPF